MTKRYILCFISLFLLTVCGCAKTREASVIQSNNCWEISDIGLNNLPPDAGIAGITDEGIYYCLTLREKMNGPEVRDDLAWHFLSFSGEDITICETDCVYYYDTLQNDTDLILNITYKEADDVVHKVLALSPDKTAREAAGEDAYCIYAFRDHLLIKQQLTEEKQYRETLILSDSLTGTETVVYQAVREYDAKTGMGNGEQIGCVSADGSNILFTIESLENGNCQQCTLYRYDFTADELTDTIMLEQQADYAVCKQDTVLLSSRDTESSEAENIVSIGELSDGTYQEASKLPVSVSAGRFFNASAMNENGYYLTSYSSCCHFWNTDTNELYIYDFGAAENRLSRDFATKQGIRYVVQGENGLIVRTLSVKASN